MQIKLDASLIQDFKAQKRILLDGLSTSYKQLLLASLSQERSLVLVLESYILARDWQEKLEAILGEKVPILADRPLNFTDSVAASHDLEIRRLAALKSLVDEDFKIILVPAVSLLSYYPQKEDFTKSFQQIKLGDHLDLDSLVVRLVDLGFERTKMVESQGKFSLRGDILDFYPAGADLAYRLSFFDQEVEQISLFDPESQRSVSTLGEVKIFPQKEKLVKAKARARLLKLIQKQGDQAIKSALANSGQKELAEKRRRLIARDLENIASEQDLVLDRYFYLLGQESTIFDYCQDLNIVIEEPERIVRAVQQETLAFHEDIKLLIESVQVLPGIEEAKLDSSSALKHLLASSSLMAVVDLKSANNGIAKAVSYTFQAQALNFYQQDLANLAKDLRRWKREDYRILVFLSDQRSLEFYQEGLKEFKQSFEQVYNFDLDSGFVDQARKIVVLSQAELGGRRRVFKKRKSAQPLAFSDLKKGDLVVHEAYGIARYQGLITFDSGGLEKEYLNLSYAGDEALYIPIEAIDQIERYISVDGRKARLSRLGTITWQRQKERARSTIKELATDLLALYAQREQNQGYAFSPDTVWQSDFEASFPFQETNDQLVAIADIKSDMESTKVMERLLCGDVGFGKTEIAFRALIKAAFDNKQAAMLVPTTVLSSQHYLNLKERLAQTPLNIALLNRFVPAKEQREIKKKVKQGLIDILIGTHRLLSKDIVFKDLGLLVIDEEQRFGVDHKEKIKNQYPQIDVLSMTATPIPRTLHMSMSGIRDISVLETGPSNRRPVQTYVSTYDPDLIDRAILAELARSGQVFYLFNNTHKIEAKTKELKARIRGAKIRYAHGQMDEYRLEETITSFIQGDFDVLVCTTIIESGIDMPRVNTIIVEDADRLGLAQLYQLRGRVGRSPLQAFAYITYRPEKILNEDAVKRLAAIRDFTELGSGFKIALKDLEVRGAGNILGASQHGHLAAIGYDLYCKILAENIRELKGEVVAKPKTKTVIDLIIPATIDSSYIYEPEQRMEIYRKINQITDQEDFYDLIDELLDRFGDPPKECLNLLNVALLKARASSMGASKVRAIKDDLHLIFAQEDEIKVEEIARVMNFKHNEGQLIFNAAKRPYLIVLNCAKDIEKANLLLSPQA